MTASRRKLLSRVDPRSIAFPSFGRTSSKKFFSSGALNAKRESSSGVSSSSSGGKVDSSSSSRSSSSSSIEAQSGYWTRTRRLQCCIDVFTEPLEDMVKTNDSSSSSSSKTSRYRTNPARNIMNLRNISVKSSQNLRRRSDQINSGTYYEEVDDAHNIIASVKGSKSPIPGSGDETKSPASTTSSTPDDQSKVFFLYDKTETISPWHDIPLVCNDTLGTMKKTDRLRGTTGASFKEAVQGGNTSTMPMSCSYNAKSDSIVDEYLYSFVCEIPKGTNAKNEIQTDQAWNPIVTTRYYKYMPQLGSSCNYGALPQTFEDPDEADPFLKDVNGDGDPLDVIELSERPFPVGMCCPIRILGSFALIDEGEADWKIVGIRHDPFCLENSDIERLVWKKSKTNINFRADDLALAKKLLQKRDANEKKMLAQRMPLIKDWFKMYKTAEGKGENTIAFDGQFVDKETTLKVIKHAHGKWKQLLQIGRSPK